MFSELDANPETRKAHMLETLSGITPREIMKH